jgi:hypothetical protein
MCLSLLFSSRTPSVSFRLRDTAEESGLSTRHTCVGTVGYWCSEQRFFHCAHRASQTSSEHVGQGGTTRNVQAAPSPEFLEITAWQLLVSVIELHFGRLKHSTGGSTCSASLLEVAAVYFVRNCSPKGRSSLTFSARTPACVAQTAGYWYLILAPYLVCLIC